MATNVGNPTVNIAIFVVFVLITLGIVIKVAAKNSSAADFYAGGRAFTGPQNGIAISGDYLSAASFLGIAGAIAVNGYDGFLYSIGFLVAWLVALLLVAELLRNTGRFTMADVLSFRLKQRPVRTAAAISAHPSHRAMSGPSAPAWPTRRAACSTSSTTTASISPCSASASPRISSPTSTSRSTLAARMGSANATCIASASGPSSRIGPSTAIRRPLNRSLPRLASVAAIEAGLAL